ncbi:MAG: hypothetical protein ONB44_01890 [candidate division KSB1 bacterium]|nr:hypothetical protein [candidate division KSB1 bacterium]MDZ7300873.1 hypothetical protein [candidate division KSB1 bacterium]MDZ7309857.1 hypothetical protein [candidate division KSB1 bacterium]
MKLSAPTFPVWLIAVIIGVLGILGKFLAIGFVTTYAFWFVLVGFVVLALSNLFKGV